MASFLVGLAMASAASAASYKQQGFSESVVFSGLTNPTVVRFLPDGRVLVAEKSGLIKIFPNLTTNTYTVVADLRTVTHNFWDRGLLGLAVPPGFDPASPEDWRRYIYVLYTHDALIGGVAPKWGVVNGTSDPCPAPPLGPGATTDGCMVSGRLSRLLAVGANWTASEQVLLEDWCQQFPSHATGSLDFGADEKLYVSGGDGASFTNSDWGQYGGTVQVQGAPGTYYTPANPCGDPPFPLGTPQTKPTAEGGALRSQSPRRTAGEPRLLNGALLRVDPSTGDALPDNPLFASADENERRIIAYGLRNPFRMIVKPGSNEAWIADVGWGTWEELNRAPDLSTARNFGWPCFEGNATQYTGLNICPPQAQTVAPFFTYNHSASVIPGDGCTTGSSSVAGMAFYQGGSNYPSSYENALFFSDYSRKCLWVMFPGGGGDPDPSLRAAFASQASGPVDLQIGPDRNLYYVNFDTGTINRVKYGLNAVATASPTAGSAPLLVDFSGASSQPAQVGDTLTYAWDLDGDGEYDDSTALAPSYTYDTPGTYVVRLKVTDQRDASDISDPITISADNTAPTAIIDMPAPSLTWKVNDTIAFSGHATDPQEGTLPATRLDWAILIQHCPSTCHAHTYQTFDGVASGSFPAPDHEYPSHIEIRLTATDTQGLTHTASVLLQPQTSNLTFQTTPAGLQLTVGTAPPQTTPFTRTVIVGSLNSVEALTPQGSFPDVWDFSAWSDGGAQTHNVTAPAAATTYTATYATHADLSLGATGSSEPAGAGATITYTLNVSNAGPSQANGLSVTDTLAPGTTFVSAGGAGWSCAGTGPVTCTLPALGIASAAPLAISVTAPPDAGAILNNASVASSTNDPAIANNSAATTTNVFAQADVSITQNGSPAAVCPGQPVTYTLNVSNAGPSAATSVTVTDTIPAGASFESVSGSGWSCSGTATVTCTRASLAVGAAPPIAITVNAPASAGTATNAASVSSPTNDPGPGLNSSNASTTVNAIPPPPAASNVGPVCAGDTLQLSASTVAGATYAWTGPNGFVSSQQNPAIPNVTPAAAGVYSVTVTVNGCASAAATTAVVVRSQPAAAVSGGAEICQGGSTQISAALTGTGPWNISWSDGLAQSAGVSPATRTVSPSTTTVYTVIAVLDAHCSGAGVGSATVTVGLPVAAPTIVAPVSVGVGATGLAARGGGHAGSTYQWALTGGTITSGLGTAQITFDAGAPGTTMVLSVTETNTACVSPAASARVQVDFLDVPPAHAFHDFVNTIARNGVTAGCGNGTTFCPDNPNTRAQMAVFLLKSKYGAEHVPPAATGTVFLDVPAADPFAPWIEELAALGVTVGCGGGNYCPGASVTRAQMAVFLLKTFLGSAYVPPAVAQIFDDVPPGAFAANWINDLYGREISGGCQQSPPLYCPTNPVTRGQMAVFLVKTFSLQ
ncbi:MAG: PQQ-dependent sugar dehydrogenase [Thermoanaerobaculia bacterium]